MRREITASIGYVFFGKYSLYHVPSEPNLVGRFWTGRKKKNKKGGQQREKKKKTKNRGGGGVGGRVGEEKKKKKKKNKKMNQFIRTSM